MSKNIDYYFLQELWIIPHDGYVNVHGYSEPSKIIDQMWYLFHHYLKVISLLNGLKYSLIKENDFLKHKPK